ncbi:selenocysteine insertion sequence-binding protein 2 isoform X4 [Aquila chrysaetos chrysaetos]|uniref:selenocysteine insertion sequence-binding protein 2 isoform X4 n=1 Tax=Aquila chrysaetos chrysaetos TaxID=223781 RepID=UPI001176C72F|nr:selenocysteine insertion sequence-binding protein 2 isoform X4 [Aquila chrysaetos chrysaetos]
MSAEGRPGSGRGGEGIKLSAEVKPFVPKHAAVTVAWSEPSEACVFPRYLTTCYPFVQEPSLDKKSQYFQPTLICNRNLTLSVLGDPAFREYSSCSYSPDVVSNVYPVAGSQYHSNNSTHCNGSGIVSESAEQRYPIRQESKNLSKQRRSKEGEKKLDKKRHDGDGSSVRIVNRTSFQTSACSRDSVKPDRFNKTTNKKSTQTPKPESLPVPTFEATILDFHKSQSLGSSEILNVQHKSGPICGAERNVACLSQPQMSLLLNTEEDTSAESKASSKTLDETVATLIPSSFDGRAAFPETPADGSAQPHVSWAMVLSQPPKKIVSSPASEGLSRCKGKQDSEAKQSETKNDASETEPEEVSEKKKKKKKKKKKTKSPTDVEKPQNEPTKVQEPPRIEDAEEFPDLAAASDRKNRLGSQKSSFTPSVRKQSEIHLPEEPWDSRSPTLDGTPKVVDGLSGKQASSSMLERKKTQETSRSSGKKSQIPVQLDLGGMLAVLEQKQQTEKSKQSSKPVVLSGKSTVHTIQEKMKVLLKNILKAWRSKLFGGRPGKRKILRTIICKKIPYINMRVGGAIPLLSKEPATATKSHRLNQGKMPHNPLDSSAPLVKKGKQREVPKAKRPTPLKKIILKEREQRKQQHLLEQTAVPKDEDSICQSTENITEDETLLQDSQAAVPAAQVAEGFLENTGIKDSTESSMTSKQLTFSLPKIHSRNFRDYCSQVLSKEVDSCVTDLLKELVRFQDRLYQKDPVKAKIKRRLVMGLREVLKHLKLKKLKCVIISPNCEKIQSKGGLDETLHNIIDCACEQNIPFVFALNRKALGRCVNKAVPVSVVGIFSYDGAQDHFHRMVQLTTEARKAYKDMIAALEEEAEGGLRETQPSILTTDYEKNGLSETVKTSSKDSDEDVPNYIKIWKRKLEEEYNPYALELEKSAAADMVIVNSEEHQ